MVSARQAEISTASSPSGSTCRIASGERDGMQKIKHHRTVDCVVGGFRYAEKKKVVGSLLLGLYDDQGLLHHVGFTSSFNAADRKQLTKLVEPLIRPPGFTGRAPGGPSRWSTRRSSEWKPLRRNSLPRSSTIISPVTDFGMAPGSCAGDRTRSQATANWTRLPDRAAAR